MQDCIHVFQEALQVQPQDSFLQTILHMLQEGSVPVSALYESCDEEIKKYLGPAAQLPYTKQKGWIHNISLAKCMVAWILEGRRNSPKKLDRSLTTTTASIPPVPIQLPLPSPLPAEHQILATTWLILEHCMGIQVGTGPAFIQSLAAALSNQSLLTHMPQKQSPPLLPRQPPLPAILPPLFYPDQLDMAQQLVQSLQQTSNYAKYEGMDFRIVVPPKISLSTQTRERLVTLLWEMFIPPHLAAASFKPILKQLISTTQMAGLSILNPVTRLDPTNVAWTILDQLQSDLDQKVLRSRMFRKGQANPDFQTLAQDILYIHPVTGKRRVFLIIVDECHFGVHKNSQLDILVNGAAHKNGSFPNPDNIFCEPNVFLINVSATGWNCHVIPHHQVIQWTHIPPNYISWESYVFGNNKDRVLVSHSFDALLRHFNSLLWTNSDLKRQLPSMLLMVDYALAFIAVSSRKKNYYHHHSWPIQPTPETLKLVEHLCTNALTADVILIRVQKNGIQAAFASWLQTFYSLLSLTRNQQQHQQQQQPYRILCPASSPESFETSLQGQRCICLVVEKARMGDSLPNLSYFDLRARYTSSTTSSFSTFLQDAGRCFGYRSVAPTLILNPAGLALLTGNTHQLDKYLQPTKQAVFFTLFPETHNPAASPRPASLILPSKTSMWYYVRAKASLGDVQAQQVLQHVATNRILLLARSQVGKTGAFIKLIELVFRDKCSSIP